MALADRSAITEQTVASLWDRHRKLAVAVADNPRLLADRCHVEAMARAERDFRAAYLGLEPTEVATTQ